MSIRLEGPAIKVDGVDRRYYVIYLTERGRRIRVPTRVRDLSLALTKEQAGLDAVRIDPLVQREDLVALVQGSRRRPGKTMRLATSDMPFLPMTLKQACDEALRDHLPWGRRRKGWADVPGSRTYASYLREIQSILGSDLPVTRICQASIEAIVEHLLRRQKGCIGKPNSGTTINRKIFAFLSVLRRLHERGLPAPRLPRHTRFDESENARQFVLTPAQETELLSQLLALDTLPDSGHPRRRDAHEYRDLFIFLADVGCRLSAGLSVRWEDVFEDGGLTFVRFFRRQHLKGGRRRTTPLTTRAAEVIHRRRAFGGTGPFAALNKDRSEHLWATAKARSSIAHEKDAVIHCLRHTCATRMLQATGDIKLVQEWLGHSTLQTTADIYAKVLVIHKVKALRRFESRWVC